MSVRLIAHSIWANPGNQGKRCQKSFAALVWQFHKRFVRKTRIIRLPNGCRFAAHPDCVVSSSLVYSDWPEYFEFQFVRQRLVRPDRIIDVGANVGHVSLLLADLVGPEGIIAFEPTPLTYTRLVENWQLNGWSNDQLMQMAIGEQEGHIYLPNVAHPQTTITVSTQRRNGTEVKVPLMPLDALRHLWQDHPLGLIKIDVEGFESAVFRGARAVLQVDRPRLLMFESLSGAMDPIVQSELAAAAYQVFQLDDHGRPDFSRCNAQNLFAIPSELRGNL